jgi:pyruvate formate lyase activating enzyme
MPDFNAPRQSMKLHEAKYYVKLEDNLVQCTLCPHNCVIPDGFRGICGVRENKGGKLYTLVYGKPVALNIDPIEKKPLYHFLPGTKILSFGTVGCNFKCIYCQNWEISQAKPEDYPMEDEIPPETIVKMAKHYGTPSIAYTYTEPTIFYEYMLDISKLAKKEGLRNVMVSNGYINEDPLKELLPYLDAANIDIKAMDEKIHRKLTVVGKLEFVLRTVKILHEAKKWLEISYLVIPGWNDTKEQVKQLAKFIVEELDPWVPVHVNAFHPDYKLTNVPPTPYELLVRVRSWLVEEGVQFVYIGNVLDNTYAHTYCPKCGEPVILRGHMETLEIKLTEDGRCPKCGEKIPGVWK